MRWAPLLTIGVMLMACGGAQRSSGAEAQHRLLFVRGLVPPSTVFRIDEVRAIEEREDARATSTDRWLTQLDEIRRLYRDLAFDEALALAATTVASIQNDFDDAASIDALHAAHILSAQCELALGHAEQAREEFRAAIVLRPEETLSEEDFPPDVRVAYEEEREVLLGQERVRLSPSTDPSSAELHLDGVSVGLAPLSIGVLAGMHYLHASAPLHAPLQLRVNVHPEAEIPSLLLTPLEGEALIASLSLATLSALSVSERVRLLRALGADGLVYAEVDGEQLQGVALDDAGVRSATHQELNLLVESLLPPIAAEREEDLWSSPWFWAGIAGGVVLVTAIVLAALLAQPSGPVLTFSTSG